MLVFPGCQTPKHKTENRFDRNPNQVFTYTAPDRSAEEADEDSVHHINDPMKDPERKGIQFYPMPPEQPKLQFLASLTDSRDSGQREYRLNMTGFIKINRPYDFGSVKGKIYISDRFYKKILIVNLDKKELNYIAGEYESAGIWVTDDDYKYAADFNDKKIVVFDDTNKLVRTYAGKDQFDKPVDVAVFQDKIYVCDLNKHQVIVIDKESGDTIQELGGVGTEDGTFYKPTHVITDTEGNIYVNDLFNFRIQKFDPDGEFIKSFGHAGDTIGSFARPKGLSVDREGHLYVVDAAFENVQIFDDETTDLMLFFGGFGLDQGQMYLPSPVFIDYHNVEYFKEYSDRDFDLEYLVYVGNTLGPRKLNIFGFGEWTGPPFIEDEDITDE